jgi:hypothetical protein
MSVLFWHYGRFLAITQKRNLSTIRPLSMVSNNAESLSGQSEETTTYVEHIEILQLTENIVPFGEKPDLQSVLRLKVPIEVPSAEIPTYAQTVELTQKVVTFGEKPGLQSVLRLEVPIEVLSSETPNTMPSTEITEVPSNNAQSIGVRSNNAPSIETPPIEVPSNNAPSIETPPIAVPSNNMPSQVPPPTLTSNIVPSEIPPPIEIPSNITPSTKPPLSNETPSNNMQTETILPTELLFIEVASTVTPLTILMPFLQPQITSLHSFNPQVSLQISNFQTIAPSLSIDDRRVVQSSFTTKPTSRYITNLPKNGVNLSESSGLSPTVMAAIIVSAIIFVCAVFGTR